jgi:hypothetical protein
LQTKHRVVNEALSAMSASAAAARDQWQEAQARLGELDQLRQENANLREEKVHAEASTRELATREDDARDARVQLAAAQAKLSDLERLLQENRTLRGEVADLRLHGEASVELERLTAEHKRLRLDAELMARRLSELLQDQAELADLRARFHDLQALGEEVAYLRRREKDLEAQLYASGSAGPDDQPAPGVPALHSVGTDMEASLRALLQPDGARSAVLADTQGFLIASAGEPMPQEGMAAFTAIASEMVARTRILLPLADVDSVRVRDTNRIVLASAAWPRPVVPRRVASTRQAESAGQEVHTQLVEQVQPVAPPSRGAAAALPDTRFLLLAQPIRPFLVPQSTLRRRLAVSRKQTFRHYAIARLWPTAGMERTRLARALMDTWQRTQTRQARLLASRPTKPPAHARGS